MPDREVLKALVDEWSGILIHGGAADWLILDRFARRHFRPGSISIPSVGSDLGQLTHRITGFLQGENDGDCGQPLQFRLHLLAEGLRCISIRDGLPALIRALAPDAFVDVVVHFTRNLNDYHALLDWAKRLATEFPAASQGRRMTISGPWGDVDDDFKRAVIRQGIQLQAVFGWPLEESAQPDEHARMAVLKHLAEFGLRVPVVWYVHGRNMHMIEELVELSLAANYNAGFAVPPLCENPYYAFQQEAPPLPEAEGYAHLLVNLYQKYPYYDDVFAPLCELAQLLSRGGWNVPHSIPTHLQVLIAPDEPVSIFRRVPSARMRWSSWETLAAMPPHDVRERLLETVRSEYAWERNQFCGSCSWRYVCGGLDPALEETKAQTVSCGYRRLFMEIFAWQRSVLHDLLSEKTGGS